MSQKKVDAYKKEKANREKLIKKEKRILMLEKLAGIAVCVVAVCWIGFSVYDKSQEDKETVGTETKWIRGSGRISFFFNCRTNRRINRM